MLSLKLNNGTNLYGCSLPFCIHQINWVKAQFSKMNESKTFDIRWGNQSECENK